MESRKAVGRASDDDFKLARRIALTVLTDFFCWIPIILMTIFSMSGKPIPDEVSAWVAVFVLPLNSALNPILYTIMVIKWKKKKS